jgi:predicted NBD/HSP70 family sugar kinase
MVVISVRAGRDMYEQHRTQKGHAYLASLYALITGGPVLDGPEAGRLVDIEPRRASKALGGLTELKAVRADDPRRLGWKRRGETQAGRDPQLAYCLSNEWGYAVGVGAGHRGIGAALIDTRGRFAELGSTLPQSRVSDHVVVGEHYQTSLETVVDQIYRCVQLRKAQLEEVGLDPVVPIRGITVGLPGQITGIRSPDSRDRRVATVLTKLRDKPIADDLGALLAARYESELGFDPRKIPIRLENDADCGAVGELHWGEGEGCESLLVVKVSGGVGAGVIVDRRLHYGHAATTGEVGHDPVHQSVLDHLNADRPNGLEPLERDSRLLECSCAVRDSGHLESFASATAVTCRVLKKRRRDIAPSEWADAVAQVVHEAVVNSDAGAKRAIEDAGFLIGRQINTLAAALGPARVLVTGPLTAADSLFLGAIHDQIAQVELPVTHAPRDVRRGATGEEAGWMGVYGAARLALEQSIWGPDQWIGSYQWPGFDAADALVRAAREKAQRAAAGEAGPAA